MLKKFIKYYRPHLLLFSADMAASVFISLLGMIYPVMTNRMLNDYIPNRAYRSIIVAGVCVLVLYFVRMLLRYFVQYQGHMVGTRMQAQMRSELFAHLERLPFSFFDDHETGAIMTRMTNDLFEVSELAHHGPENLLTCSIMIVLSFSYLCTINVWLTLIIFACVPFLALVSFHYRKKMRAAFTERRKSNAVINAALESSITGIRVTKAYTNAEKEVEKFEKAKRKNKLVRKIRKVGNWLLDHGFATWAILILIWQIISLFYDDTFLPGPVSTLKGGLEIILDGKLLLFSLISLKRVLIGWVIGTLVAAPLGLLVGRVIILRRLVEPFINFFRFIPALALLTLFLMWFGVGEFAKIIMIVLATFIPVLASTIQGVKSINPLHIRSAKTLGCNEFQLFYHVIVKTAAPFIIAGMKTSISLCFSALVVAEMIGSDTGLGFIIVDGRNWFKVANMFMAMTSIALLQTLFQGILTMLERKLFKWKREGLASAIE